MANVVAFDLLRSVSYAAENEGSGVFGRGTFLGNIGADRSDSRSYDGGDGGVRDYYCELTWHLLDK